MIFTDRTITVRKGESRIDEPIVVYRGDYELEVRFTILNSKFRFMSGTNLIESEKASYGQLAILTPYGGNIFSDIVRCNDGSVTFVLTADMLNQIEEVGLYSFQIRLMDYTKESRVSIPPIEFGIEVREPIASEDHDNSVNNAIVGYSIAKVVDPKEENVGNTFDESGNYNKTKWETGDRISEGKLNKIEDAIDGLNKNVKTEIGQLDRRITSNYSILDNRINEIIRVESNTNGNTELIDIRNGVDGVTYSTAGEAVRKQLSDLNYMLSDVTNVLGEEKVLTVSFDDLIPNYVYTNYHTGGIELINYNSYIKNVSVGEEYLITANLIPNDTHSLAYIMNSEDEIIEFIYKNENGESKYIVDYEVVIPGGGSKLIICAHVDSPPKFKKKIVSFDAYNTMKTDLEKINDSLKYILIEELDPYLIEVDKVYLPDKKAPTSLYGGRTYTFSVTPGDVLYITTTVYASTDYGVVNMYTEDGRYIETIGRYTPGMNVSVVNYEVVVPQGAYIARVCCDYRNTTIVYKEEEYIKNVVDELDGFQDELTTFKNIISKDEITEIKVDSVEKNTIYNKSYNTPTSFNGYNTYNYIVEGGGRYRISTGIIANSLYAAAIFFDENGENIGYVYPYVDETSVINAEIVAPIGAKIMKCCRISYFAASVCKVTRVLPDSIYSESDTSNLIAYRVEDSNIYLSYKLGEDSDFVVNLCCKGGNNIFDFYCEGEIKNQSINTSDHFSEMTQLMTHNTDWHCPYIVSAINNQDGDNKNSDGSFKLYFTGGNHQYNNRETGSSCTGRTEYVRFFVDGREINNGYGFATNNIEIRWSNLIQGFNTTKSDGSGREILRENHTMIFDGRVFNSHVEIIPLEDINMHTWYGFQCYRGPLLRDNTRFIGGSNRSRFYGDTSNADSGQGKAHTIINEGSKYGLKITLDPDYDMGCNENRVAPYAFNSGDKSYFNLTDGSTGINMYKDESYYIRGSYEFFRI